MQHLNDFHDIQRTGRVNHIGDPPDELLPLVTPDGTVVGHTVRSRVHQSAGLLHPTVHVFVTNRSGDLLMQRRGPQKTCDPMLWDVSVSGHVRYGETPEATALREVSEEIGLVLSLSSIHFLYRYLYSDSRESELVHSFQVSSDGPFRPNQDELDELRFWSTDEIAEHLDRSVFTQRFSLEFQRFRDAVTNQIPDLARCDTR